MVSQVDVAIGLEIVLGEKIRGRRGKCTDFNGHRSPRGVIGDSHALAGISNRGRWQHIRQRVDSDLAYAGPWSSRQGIQGSKAVCSGHEAHVAWRRGLPQGRILVGPEEEELVPDRRATYCSPST